MLAEFLCGGVVLDTERGEDAGREAGVAEGVGEGDGAAWDAGGVFEDDDVTGGEGGGGEADDLPEGVIPGHDAEDWAERIEAAVTAAAAEDELGGLEEFGGVLGEVFAGGSTFADFGFAGGDGFAHFLGGDGGQVGTAAAEQDGQGAESSGALFDA